MSSTVRVPFVNLGLQYKAMREQIIAEIDRISLAGQYVSSEDVVRFEKSFAAYCGTSEAVAVGNGGDALYLVLMALGIGPGTEVIVPANSFVASAWAVAGCGAKVVFVDVTDDYNLDPAKVERAITSRTKAIMPVHLTGRPAPMNEILQIAGEHKIPVVEDAAQAVGATYHGRKMGSMGIAGCFSLHPLKNLHVHGDGGVITTSDKRLAEQLRQWRNHGLKNRDECVFWGRNSRLDSIQAAIANLKLPHLDTWNQRFRDIAAVYTRELADVVSVPKERLHEKCVYHRYIVTTPERSQLQTYLEARGVETKVNYPIPLHLQQASQGYKKGDFPVAERLAENILSLPIYAEMTDAQVEIVVAEVKNYFKAQTRKARA